ncbi:ABC transporter ATP-binding protein [Pedobacter sp. AW31-3R]|uniref:ABC transporter ATP-binding protein n=1 Tax=Pedobacter sp. AW31-3R TaxID=3445781 RepID=UPI003F9F13B3
MLKINRNNYRGRLHYFFFKKYVARYLKTLFIIFFLLLLTSVCSLASPYALKIIIDQAFPHKDHILLIKVLLFLVSIYVVRLVTMYATEYYFALMGNRIVKEIRLDIFNHLLLVPPIFFEENKVGELVHKISNEVDRVEYILTNGVTRYVTNILTVAGLIVMLYILNKQLFFVSIVLFPLIIYTTIYFTPILRRQYKKASKREAGINHFFTERLSNVKFIRLFNAMRHESDKLNSMLTGLINVNLNTVKTSSVNRNLSLFFIALGPVTVFGFGGWQVFSDQATLGTIVAFLQYLNRLYAPSTDLINFHNDLIKAKVSMQQLVEILNTPVDENFDAARSGIAMKERIDKISFKDVSFRYTGLDPVIDRISFDFETGKKYAIVGPSGAGKSTLVNLICKLLQPCQGIMMVNDTFNLKTLNQIEWLENICIVPQEPQMYTDSIRENVRYGSYTKTDRDILHVLEKVGFSEFVTSHPQGLDFEIDNKGFRLSFGQMQRIALARAILRNPQVLILDEATSALDTESEQFILGNIFKLFKDKLVIIISHRITTIVDVDEILYLKDGKLISAGNHESVVSNRDKYTSLFRA